MTGQIEALRAKAETGEQWAEICRLEAEQNGGPFFNKSETLTSDSDVVREAAWLIEKEQHARNGGPLYWGTEDGEPRWTAEHQYAKRFETKEAAEREAEGCGLNDWFVAEHAWQRASARPVSIANDLIAALKDIEFIVDGKEDADDGIPNDAMKIMAIVRTALRKAAA